MRFEFQMTPGTECPAEMNFLIDGRALCMAENATHNLHNLLTLRGAQVRDARMWSRDLAEAVELFVDHADVAFASHHWPMWGAEAIGRFLAQQRDLYGYLHDQTLRLMNQGQIGSEIAETMEVSPELDAAWHTHGYYGSISHGVKAIYQRYLGWYDGNPAHLWQHPPEAAATRYVDVIGGVAATGRQGQGLRASRRPALRSRARQPRRVRPTRRRRSPPDAGRRPRAARIRRRERAPGATASSWAPMGCARSPVPTPLSSAGLAAAPTAGIVVVRPESGLFYGNADNVHNAIRDQLDDRTRAVVIDAETMPAIDVTAVGMIVDLRDELGHRSIGLYIARDVGQVRDLLETAGAATLVEHLYPSVEHAVSAAGDDPPPRD